MVDLRSKGVHTVVIDPRLTPDAAKADVWLPIRPGTDVALMLAWIRFIMEEKLYDEEFVMKWTNLPYLVDTETKMFWRDQVSEDPDIPDIFMVWDEKSNQPKPMEYPWNDELQPALLGTYTYEGKTYKTGFQLLWEQVEQYTLEYAGGICELEPERIEKAIRLYAQQTPSGIAIGVSTDQTPNSVQAAMSTATLDLLMGNVERPGALLQRFRTSGVFDMPNYPVPIAADKLPDEQLKKRLGGIEHKGLHIWYAGHITSIMDAVLTGKPYKPRVWIDRSGNKMAAVADSQKVKRVIDELDSGIFEYLLGELLTVMKDNGKGQMLFTSHNLRPLEMLDKSNLVFSTTNPENRYIHMQYVKQNNNLRDMYLRSILLGGQKEELYEETDTNQIARAFRRAGKAVIYGKNS